MAFDNKYGRITAENKVFHDDEPLFVLRATDRNVVETILEYATICHAAGCSEAHVQGVKAQAEAILKWQSMHPELVKLPD